MKPPHIKRALAAGFPAALLLVGAVLAGTGLLGRDALGDLAARTVPILVFVAAMTVVTELADRAGLFRIVTAALARAAARGDASGTQTAGTRSARPSGQVLALWGLVLALATASTIFFSLDTTAVLVTPVVVALARQARIAPLPFALATVWLANTASLLLPVSNLTNLLAQHRLGLPPWEFAALLWAPALVGLVVPAIFLLLFFHRDLRGRYTPPRAPVTADRPLLVLSAITVVLLLPALVSGLPVAVPAGIAAVFLVGVFLVRDRAALRWRLLPAQPLMLAGGLFLVVATLQAHGLAAALARVAGSGEDLGALLQLAASGALSANLVNNLPAYLALEPVAGSPVRLAALLIGVNLGPLVSPWASLATLLWHARLKALGISIAWRGYVLAGLAVVVVLLPTAVLALWLTVGMPR